MGDEKQKPRFSVEGEEGRWAVRNSNGNIDYDSIELREEADAICDRANAALARGNGDENDLWEDICDEIHAETKRRLGAANKLYAVAGKEGSWAVSADYLGAGVILDRIDSEVGAEWLAAALNEIYASVTQPEAIELAVRAHVAAVRSGVVIAPTAITAGSDWQVKAFGRMRRFKFQPEAGRASSGTPSATNIPKQRATSSSTLPGSFNPNPVAWFARPQQPTAFRPLPLAASDADYARINEAANMIPVDDEPRPKQDPQGEAAAAAQETDRRHAKDEVVAAARGITLGDVAALRGVDAGAYAVSDGECTVHEYDGGWVVLRPDGVASQIYSSQAEANAVRDAVNRPDRVFSRRPAFAAKRALAAYEKVGEITRRLAEAVDAAGICYCNCGPVRLEPHHSANRRRVLDGDGKFVANMYALEAEGFAAAVASACGAPAAAPARQYPELRRAFDALEASLAPDARDDTAQAAIGTFVETLAATLAAAPRREELTRIFEVVHDALDRDDLRRLVATLEVYAMSFKE